MSPDIAKARQFMAAHARILERRCLERLLDAGPPEPILDALRSYRNPDGGFGNALEPDGRSPGSQPVATLFALDTMNHYDAWDEELVAGALDQLQSTAPPEGGATFVDPSVKDWPHAPWWQPTEGLPASTIITGQLLSPVLERGVQHTWVDGAVKLMWERVEAFETPEPGAGAGYELLGAFSFLDFAPDRERAGRAIEVVGRAMFDGGHVALDPAAEGEVHGVLTYAPLPGSAARALFDAPDVERALDHLAGAQSDEGGWTFNWQAWLPLAKHEWDGAMTVEALRVLQSNGVEVAA